MEEPKERVRINAKQTAKGAWQFEATFEHEDAVADGDYAAAKLLTAVKAAEGRFQADGKVIAGAE